MLYHKDLGFPKELTIKLQYLSGQMIDLTYSRHAIMAANTDKYGQMNLIAKFKFDLKQVVECELDRNGSVIKMVVRLPYDKTRDAVLVLIRGGFVKTVWFNLNSDKHISLDTSKYMRVA